MLILSVLRSKEKNGVPEVGCCSVPLVPVVKGDSQFLLWYVLDIRMGGIKKKMHVFILMC